MATLYQDIWNLKNASFNLKQRVTVAVAKAAIDILSEDPGTANHANRVIWASNTLLRAELTAEGMMWPVLSDATVRNAGEAATDAQIQSAVDASVDIFAIGV